jgi:hypothetical protein
LGKTKLASSPDIIRNDSWNTFGKTLKGRGRMRKQRHWEALLKHRAVILISPNQDLGNGTDGLHQQIPVLFCDCGVFG